MRKEIIERTLYKFDELSEDAKDEAINNLSDINVDYEWWDSVYDDAHTIGLKITEFDIDRGSFAHGHFETDAESVAQAIIESHGESAETYKDAQAYLKDLATLREHANDGKDLLDGLDDEPDTQEIDSEFLNTLLEDYRIMLQHEFEYLTSREAIVETIKINDYEFTENGELS